MKTVHYLSLVIVILSMTTACKKNVDYSLPSTSPQSITAHWDKTVVEVARDVSAKLNNAAFRKVLKHEVLLRFDGDANILISSLVKRLPRYVSEQASNCDTFSSPSKKHS